MCIRDSDSTDTLTLKKVETINTNSIKHNDAYLDGYYELTLPGDYSDVYGYGTLNVNTDQIKSFTISTTGGNTVIPVSYTHLDVYKRQAVYYINNIDQENGNGDLHVMANGEDTLIDTGVYSMQYKYNGKLAYLKNYDYTANKGDLYYYDGKESKEIDTGITAIFMY